MKFVFLRRINVYHFLRLSFPHLTRRIYNNTVRSPSFQGWVIGYTEQNLQACTCAIFRRETKIKMGLFCVHPQFRQLGYGKALYQYLCKVYSQFQWTTNTKSAAAFWLKMKAKIIRTYSSDGVTHHVFVNQVIEEKKE